MSIQEDEAIFSQTPGQDVSIGTGAFRAVVENSYDTVIMMDANGVILYANPSIINVSGYPSAEHIGKNYFDCIHPDDQGHISALHAQLLDQPNHFVNAQLRYQHKNGSWLWVDIRIRNSLTRPDINALVCTMRDSTHRKQEEDQLRFQASITRCISDAVIATDMNYYILSWNSAAEQMYGWSQSEVLGRHSDEFLYGDFLTDSREQFRQQISEVGSWHGEVSQKHKNGQTIYVMAAVSVVKDDTGSTIGSVTVNRDITAQKLAEQERLTLMQQIAAERARLAAVIQQLPAGVIIAEAPSGKIILVNEQVERIWRRPFIASITVHDYGNGYQAFHSDGTPYQSHEWPLARSVMTGEVVEEEELAIIRGDGTHGTISISSAPIFDHTGQISASVSVFYDITERKRLEQTKDEFISMASHELKTPLTTVKGYTQILQRRFRQKPDDQVSQFLSKMDRQLVKLTGLINDLLDLSRMEGGKLTLRKSCFDLSESVCDVVENVQAVTRTHRIELQGATNGIMINGDRDRIEQVLLNLINNAIKYSPKADRVLIRITTDQHYVTISVQDFGIGIDKQYQSHIFERFYRVKESAEKSFAGLGLGLYISRKIIDWHAGILRVESQKGKGSTFFCSLPLR